MHTNTQPIAPRRLSILGATGSIGDSTLKVVRQHRAAYPVAALTAQHNAQKLIQLALECKPAMVAIANETHYAEVKAALQPHGIRVAAGEAGVLEAAAEPCELSMSAIVGAAGLKPTLMAIEQGRCVLIANKEAIVCAGELMLKACKAHGTTLLPVDSEHNAIFQVLACAPAGGQAEIEKITLTASGGPVLDVPLESLEHITPEQAVAHPRWRMGAKISIDSATMMNKGLELIEAHDLFGLPCEQLDVLIHPESIVHSLVHYTDGSVLAQLGAPDMAIPIAYAMGYPKRLAVLTPRLDLAALGRLHFRAPESARFPALGLARRALNEGLTHRIALNAANEIAVAAFLKQHIPFTAIVHIVAEVLAETERSTIVDVAAVMQADAAARRRAERHAERMGRG